MYFYYNICMIFALYSTTNLLLTYTLPYCSILKFYTKQKNPQFECFNIILFLGNILYWCDGVSRKIERYDLLTKKRDTIFHSQIYSFVSITLGNGYMYFAALSKR